MAEAVIPVKITCQKKKFSLKLSLAYSEMDESSYITDTHVCADFTLSRMTMQSQEEKSYSGSETEMLYSASTEGLQQHVLQP